MATLDAETFATLTPSPRCSKVALCRSWSPVHVLDQQWCRLLVLWPYAVASVLFTYGQLCFVGQTLSLLKVSPPPPELFQNNFRCRLGRREQGESYLQARYQSRATS